ncbi:lipocalin-like domain-containing protein [Staphylococcus xylosus]|uniref:lipocalin-like domain-containing protein n=1 Tax=Staphylococcus xylosus TaxID=1288 RepID=UPI002DBB3EA3|nr:lipocalin-like domain-containing protein [Staphylococcus xylosus]MEB7811351.1 lipocalin-like domain-containing protein [Staphylococcus xylosus]
MQQGRRNYGLGDLHKGTTEEMTTVAERYLAYSGKFKIDVANATLYHTMDVSMNTTWLGNTQPLEYTLDDNVLTLVNGNNRN